ncbi:DUF2059 domain-containing protein [Sphingomonas sp. LT1P40]|uniref:DUF2059 domain-containing protein n=1 Tax=Alteristakelama amylovorans TaxID=3096166 RepID=UPI002FC5CB40
MIRAAIAAASLALAAPAFAQGDPAAIAAAERLVEAMGVGQQFDQMFAMMAPMMAKNAMAQLEAGQASRPFFEELVKGDYARKQRMEAILAEEYLSAMRAQTPRMKREYAREYAGVFTAAELDQLAAFFSQGTGAKFIAETAGLQTKLGQVGQRIGLEVGMVATPKALERAKSELDAETKK